MKPITKLPLHDQAAESLDDIAGGGGAFAAVAEDQARRGEVERQPHHRGDEQDGRESAEFAAACARTGRHQDQHRDGERQRQAEVEQPATAAAGSGRPGSPSCRWRARGRCASGAASMRAEVEPDARHRRRQRHAVIASAILRSDPVALRVKRGQPPPAASSPGGGNLQSRLPYSRSLLRACGWRCPGCWQHGCGCRGSDRACRE